MNNLSHGIDYSKFAYRVAFLRQFYTISSEQGENAKQQRHGRIGESDELDTSTNRKWKSVMTKLGKKKRASSRSVNSSERRDRRRILGGSINNGNVWNSFVKKRKRKQPRRRSF